MTSTQHGTLDLEGASLSYDVQDGDGPTVVILHGVGSSRASENAAGYLDWTPFTDTGRRIVRYDARGHGRSTGQPNPEDYTWASLADDLLALLDHVAPGETVDAVGSSMGVGTILHAVTRRPDRFRRLALVIPPTAWETRATQAGAYQQMAALLDAQGRDALLAAAASAPTLPLLAAGGWTIPAPDVQEALFSTVLRGAAIADFPTRDAIAAIQQPTLLLPWTDDPAHPVSTAEQLVEILPNADLRLNQTPNDVLATGSTVTNFLTH